MMCSLYERKYEELGFPATLRKWKCHGAVAAAMRKEVSLGPSLVPALI